MALFLSLRSRGVRRWHLGALLTSVSACLLLGYWAASSLGKMEARSPRQPSAADNRGWQTLQSDQRETLMPLSREWATLDVSNRERWLKTAALLQKKTATERARAQERLVEWAKLSPANRSAARLHFASVRHIPAEKRKSQWSRYAEQSEKSALKRRNADVYVPVAPSMVQVKPGATTVLLDRVTPRRDFRVPYL